MQTNCDRRVGVQRRWKCLSDNDLAVELFSDFPTKRSLRRLTGFNLAPRKLPGERKVFVRWTLSDQYSSLALDQSANDSEGRSSGGHRAGDATEGYRVARKGIGRRSVQLFHGLGVLEV